MAGHLGTARGDVRRRRRQRRGLVGGGGGRRPVRLRRERRGDPLPARREHVPHLPRVHRGAEPRPALRLPRPRPVGSRARAAVQPGQAAHRPVRARVRRAAQPQRRDLRPQRARRHGAQRRGLGAVRPEVGRRQRPVRLGRRLLPGHRLGGDGHLRGARQGDDDASPEGSAAPARDLPGPGAPRGHRAPAQARGHRRRAAADPPLHQRGPPAVDGPGQLLGLQHARVLRPARRLQLLRARGQQVTEFKRHGARICTPRGSR